MISVLILKEEVTEKRMITKYNIMRERETLKMFTMMRMIATPSVTVCQSGRAGTCPASPSRSIKGLKSRRRRVDAAAALRSLG